MVEYIIDNKEWIFSGIGVAVISWFIEEKADILSTNKRYVLGEKID